MVSKTIKAFAYFNKIWLFLNDWLYTFRLAWGGAMVKPKNENDATATKVVSGSKSSKPNQVWNHKFETDANPWWFLRAIVGCNVTAPRGWSRGGDWGDFPPKTYESNFFTVILNNSENIIRDIRPFCRPLFCHCSVVKYTSSLL